MQNIHQPLCFENPPSLVISDSSWQLAAWLPDVGPALRFVVVRGVLDDIPVEVEAGLIALKFVQDLCLQLLVLDLDESKIIWNSTKTMINSRDGPDIDLPVKYQAVFYNRMWFRFYRFRIFGGQRFWSGFEKNAETESTANK